MRRRRFRRTGSRSKARQNDWSGLWLGGHMGAMDFSPGTGALGEAYAAWVTWPGDTIPGDTGISHDGLLQPVGRTIVDLRANICFKLEFDALSINSSIILGMGVCKMECWDPNSFDNQIFEAGFNSPTAFPLPVFDANEDWIYRDTYVGVAGESTEAAFSPTYLNFAYGSGHSRAKRKLGPGEGLLFVFQPVCLTDDVLNADVWMTLDIRTLLKSGTYTG